MTTPDKLKAWCIGLGINPNVIEMPEMKREIDMKDGSGAFSVLRAKAQSLSGQSMNDNEVGVLFAAMLAGRLK